MASPRNAAVRKFTVVQVASVVVKLAALAVFVVIVLKLLGGF
jgi:hypothetical protein